MDGCRSSIREEQVALTQGLGIAVDEPRQSVPRFTRVRILCRAFVRVACDLAISLSSSKHAVEPRVNLSASRVAERRRQVKVARAILFRGFPHGRAPAEDDEDGEDVRTAHLERVPIPAVRWRRNGKYICLLSRFLRSITLSSSRVFSIVFPLREQHAFVNRAGYPRRRLSFFFRSFAEASRIYSLADWPVTRFYYTYEHKS